MKRPLITDQDERSGLDKLFKPWVHYIPYDYNYNGLERAMNWTIDNYYNKAMNIANAAYDEVCEKHLVKHRIDQILEVVNA
jgi:hypothetical protein